MLVILMVLFAVCTVSPMILKLYALFAGEFRHFNSLETAVYMFRCVRARVDECVLCVRVVCVSGVCVQTCERGARQQLAQVLVCVGVLVCANVHAWCMCVCVVCECVWCVSVCGVCECVV